MENPQTNQTLVPYFMVLSAPQFIDFTKNVFSAEVGTVTKLEGTEGVIHAEMKIGESIIYFADTSYDGSCGPGICGELKSDGLVPIQMFIYVEKVADTYEKAIASGADIHYGSYRRRWRSYGRISNPSGNIWWVKSLNQ